MRALLVASILIVAALGGLAWWTLRSDSAPPAVPSGATSRSGESPTATDPTAAPTNATTTAPARTPAVSSANIAPNAPWISARVVGRNSAPVADANVTVRGTGPAAGVSRLLGVSDPQPVFRARTGADGRFELRGPPPGEVRVEVRATGYAPLERLELAPVERAELADFRLVSGVALAGHVLDVANRPVVDAQLTLPGADLFDSAQSLLERALVEPLARTDKSGAFRIESWTAGPWRVVVTADAYPSAVAEGDGSATEDVVIRLGAAASIAGRLTFAAAPDAAGVLERAARGEIVVRAQRAGDPAELGADIDNLYREAPIRDDGAFEISGLRVGAPYRVRARLAVTAPDQWFGAGTNAKAGDRDVELAIGALAGLKFRALDARTNAPLPGVRVQLISNSDTLGVGSAAASRAEGLIYDPATGNGRLDALWRTAPSWRHRLSIQSEGYRSFDRADVALQPGEHLDLGEVRLEPLPQLSVRVVDATTGAPIARAEIRIDNPEQGLPDARPAPAAAAAVTDADGRAQVRLASPSACLLWASHADYALESAVAIVDAQAAPAEVELRLAHGGALEVTLQAEDGSPRAGRPVIVRRSGSLDERDNANYRDREVRAWTDASSVARFERLVAGNYEVACALLSNDLVGVPQSQEATVKDGARTTFTLAVPREVAVAGTVSEGGRALVGARVSYFPGPLADLAQLNPWFLAQSLTARTGTDGSFALPAVPEPPEGAATLIVQHAERVLPSLFELTWPIGPKALSIDLPLVEIQGSVRTSSGGVASGATVLVREASENAMELSNLDNVFLLGADEQVSVSVPLPCVGRAHADSVGRFTLRGVPADVDLVVIAEADGARRVTSKPVRATQSGVISGVDLVLGPAGKIAVHVRSAQGLPVGSARIVARRLAEAAAGEVRTLGSDGRDEVVFEGLAPGRHEVVLYRRDASGAFPSRTVEVTDGTTVEVLFDLP